MLSARARIKEHKIYKMVKDGSYDFSLADAHTIQERAILDGAVRRAVKHAPVLKTYRMKIFLPKAHKITPQNMFVEKDKDLRYAIRKGEDRPIELPSEHRLTSEVPQRINGITRGYKGEAVLDGFLDVFNRVISRKMGSDKVGELIENAFSILTRLDVNHESDKIKAVIIDLAKKALAKQRPEIAKELLHYRHLNITEEEVTELFLGGTGDMARMGTGILYNPIKIAERQGLPRPVIKAIATAYTKMLRTDRNLFAASVAGRKADPEEIADLDPLTIDAFSKLLKEDRPGDARALIETSDLKPGIREELIEIAASLERYL